MLIEVRGRKIRLIAMQAAQALKRGKKVNESIK
jgi:hypothetical protein